MSKYSPCNDCGIDVETESCNTCEVDSLRKQVDSLRTRAESAEQKLVRFYSEHGIGWCGHHGYQGMKDEGESCPKCRAESAEEAFKAAEGEHAELWAERNGWQARAESAERERDEAYAKGQRERTQEVEARLNALVRHLTIHAELSDQALEDNAFQEAASDVEIALRDILALPIKERPQ